MLERPRNDTCVRIWSPGLGPGWLLFLDDDGAGAIVAEAQVGATGQTVAVFGDGTEDAEADAADKARGDDVAVAEAGGAEIDVDTGGQDQMCGPGARRRQERRQQIGQQRLAGRCRGVWWCRGR